MFLEDGVSMRARVGALVLGLVVVTSLAGCTNGGLGGSGTVGAASTGCSAGTVPENKTKTYDASGTQVTVEGRPCFDLLIGGPLVASPSASSASSPSFCARLASERSLNQILGHGLLSASPYGSIPSNVTDSIIVQGTCTWQTNFLESPQPTPTGVQKLTFAPLVGVSYVYDTTNFAAAEALKQNLLVSPYVTTKPVAKVGEDSTLFVDSRDTENVSKDVPPTRTLVVTDLKGVTLTVTTNTKMPDNQLVNTAKRALSAVESAGKS